MYADNETTVKPICVGSAASGGWHSVGVGEIVLMMTHATYTLTHTHTYTENICGSKTLSPSRQFEFWTQRPMSKTAPSVRVLVNFSPSILSGSD